MKSIYRESKQYFINPYNFVPTNCENKEAKNNDSELLTGYLTCSLKCRTPLAIPDTEHPDVIEKHSSYPFLGTYQEGTNPRIPGSSIRGVIRNVYETITDSCFVTMKKDTMISRRDRLTEKGILLREDNGWNLYSADRYLLVINKEHYENISKKKSGIGNFSDVEWEKEYGKDYYGKAVRFTYTDWKNKKYVKNICEKGSEEVSEEGYLCIGEEASARKYQSIFKRKNKEEITITQDDIERLDYVVKRYRNEAVNRNLKDENCRHYGYKGYEMAKNNGVIPVYYKIEQEKLYMSLAAMGRDVYYTTLDNVAGVKRCDGSRDKLCPACSLFGIAEGEKYGSSVRFTDGKCTDFKKENLQKVRFQELASPRISYIPFYLERQDASSKSDIDYDAENVKIRGRKYYWHHEPKIVDNECIEATERNATFHVLKDSTFVFKVYFDGITREQLQILSTALHLGDNTLEGTKCHKIGHGKPLGYGSVKIQIDRCVIRKYDANGWKLEPEAVYADKKILTKDNCWEALMRITDFHAVSVDVEYPKIIVDADTKNLLEKMEKTNEYASHQWFNNYKKDTGQIFNGIVGHNPLQHYELENVIYTGEIVECKENVYKVICERTKVEGIIDVSTVEEPIRGYLVKNLKIRAKIQMSLKCYSDHKIEFSIIDLHKLKYKNKFELFIDPTKKKAFMSNGLPVFVENIQDFKRVKGKYLVEVVGIKNNNLILKCLKKR